MQIGGRLNSFTYFSRLFSSVLIPFLHFSKSNLHPSIPFHSHRSNCFFFSCNSQISNLYNTLSTLFWFRLILHSSLVSFQLLRSFLRSDSEFFNSPFSRVFRQVIERFVCFSFLSFEVIISSLC